MHRMPALMLAAALAAAGPAAAQTAAPDYEPIPVETDDDPGSSGAALGSIASTGSTALAVVGLLTIVVVGAVVAATD